ncbi:hypothetical protein [Echinicola shivajiensis]|uniref:hypothetical protein n=1 Tax=Echinicola shivajiensis TaxID=1035916 RepID=UPI001BFC34AA|nr:hypothetical protein [Echinicola shivajiensis]
MDVLLHLQEGYSKTRSMEVVKYVGDDKDRFAHLFDVFVKSSYRISQRAAHPIALIVERNPVLLLPYYTEVIDLLKRSDVHDAVKRNIFRMLQNQDVPMKFEGEILDLAFAFLVDNKQPIAIRVFSMQVVFNLSVKYPEIKEELRIVLEDMLPYGSAGIRNRAKKILSKLDVA